MDSSFLFGIALSAYLAASVAYLAHLAFRHAAAGFAATGITVAGFAIQTVAIGFRWREKAALSGFGHIPPVSNMYESMLFWGWSIIFIYLVFETVYKNRSLGAVVTPLAFLAIAGVSIAPNISQKIEPLVPALQSNWLAVHVMTSFFGYAAFTVSFGVSLLYLVFTSDRRDDALYVASMAVIVTIATLLTAVFTDFAFRLLTGKTGPYLFATSLASPELGVRLLSWMAVSLLFTLMWYLGTTHQARVSSLFPDLRTLEEVSYRAVMVGFPMLTIGIVTGAAWANYAWGTYWSWDPKETWSLITWFIYAAFLHARITAGWKGRRTSALSLAGFGAVVFTYLGVNFLLSGLHVYTSP